MPAVVDPGWRVAPTNLLATAFVDGDPGATLLGRPGGPVTVGKVFGAAWRAMQTVDPDRLDLPVSWSSGAGLAAAGDRPGRAVAQLAAAARPGLIRELAVARELLAGRRTGFVHGDFVPVNALVADGRLAGLLDFESAGVAEPLSDSAWFAWIVGYHHPAVAGEAWASFLAAAEIVTDDCAA